MFMTELEEEELAWGELPSLVLGVLSLDIPGSLGVWKCPLMVGIVGRGQ